MARMSERAQSLLIGAVFMAVIFVSLALLLNSSLYGTTLATDASDGVTGGDGQVLQDSVRDDVGYLIERSIEEEHTSGAQETYVENGVNELGPRYRDYYAQYDRIVDVSLVPSDHKRGTRISQQSGTFEYDSDADSVLDSNPDATDTRLRNATIDVSNWPSGPDDFQIEIAATDTWEITMYESGTGARVDVYRDGTLQGRCETTDTHPTVGLTNASVVGQYCDPLTFLEDLSPGYDVTFENGDQIEGAYSLTASGSSVNGANDRDALYSMTVDLWERTPETRYSTQIRVAPGEPR